MSRADPGTYVGAILVGAFFLLMARIFYWLLVIVPRKTKEIYTRLEARGYAPQIPDDESVARTLTQTAAIFPKDPMIDAEVPAWDVKRSAIRNQWGRQRLLVNAQRLQRDSPGVKYNSGTRTTTILVEPGPLPIQEDVHLVPAENDGSIRWEERYHLARVSSGPDEELLARYEVYAAARAAVTLPAPLVRALIEVCPRLVDTSRFCFQHGVSLRFGSGGWGITTSNEVHRQESMDCLLDVADRISEALGS